MVGPTIIQTQTWPTRKQSCGAKRAILTWLPFRIRRKSTISIASYPSIRVTTGLESGKLTRCGPGPELRKNWRKRQKTGLLVSQMAKGTTKTVLKYTSKEGRMTANGMMNSVRKRRSPCATKVRCHSSAPERWGGGDELFHLVSHINDLTLLTLVRFSLLRELRLFLCESRVDLTCPLAPRILDIFYEQATSPSL